MANARRWWRSTSCRNATHVTRLRLRDERTVFLRFFCSFLRTVGRGPGPAIQWRCGRGRMHAGARCRAGLILCALGVGLSRHATTVAVLPGMSRLGPSRARGRRPGILRSPASPAPACRAGLPCAGLPEEGPPGALFEAGPPGACFAAQESRRPIVRLRRAPRASSRGRRRSSRRARTARARPASAPASAGSTRAAQRPRATSGSGPSRKSLPSSFAGVLRLKSRS